MRVTGLWIILLIAIIFTSCNNKATSDKNVLRDSVNTYDLLNYLLTDTVEIGLVMDGYKIISDIDRLPPPIFYGKFIDHVSEVLSEKDTTYIRSQLRKRSTSILMD